MKTLTDAQVGRALDAYKRVSKHSFCGDVMNHKECMRAALSTLGPEEPSEGANPDWLIPMARRALHIAFVWNDHNYPSCRNMALDTAEEYGIKSFEDANTVLKSVYAVTPRPADAGKETPELIPGVNDVLSGLTIKV